MLPKTEEFRAHHILSIYGKTVILLNLTLPHHGNMLQASQLPNTNQGETT